MGKAVLIFAIIILFVVTIALMVWFIVVLQELRECTNYPSPLCADVVCPDGKAATTQ